MKSSRIIVLSLAVLLVATSLFAATTKAPAAAKSHGKSVHGSVAKLDESAKTFDVDAGKKATMVQWNDATKVTGGTLKDGETVTVKYMVHDGKADAEQRSAFLRIQDFHRSRMSAHDLIDDRQSEAGALGVPAPGICQTDESLEDPRALRRGDAGSALGHADLASLLQVSAGHADPASVRRIADRVDEEIA